MGPPRSNLWIYLVGALLAVAVPLAWQFGVDLCAITNAVGVHLDACASPAPPASPTDAAPARDAGAPE